MAEDLARKAARGVVWSTVDRFANMGLVFIINLVMARLLLPSDYGTIGVLTIFLVVAQTLVDGGFTSALIQKKEPTPTDYSTIFYWNVGLSVLLYLALYVSAPWVARFFNMPVLGGVLRVLGLLVVMNGIMAVQNTRLRKRLEFKKLALVNVTAYAVSGAIGIVMAYHGMGVWSLVAQQLSAAVLIVVMLLVITRWLPSASFSKESLRSLFGFGGFILAANILQETCKNFQSIIIGRRFSETQMGYYSQAQKLDNVVSYSIPQSIVTVMYPLYAGVQDRRERMIEILEMNVRVISYVIFPLLALLILLSDTIIVGLYGAQWAQSVPYYRILCVGGMFVCLQNVNFYAVAAKGRSRTLFNWSIYKWSFLLAAMLVGSVFGMEGLLWGMVVSNFNIYLVNAALVQRHIGLGVLRQLSLLVPVFLATVAAMALAAVSAMGNLHFIVTALVFVVSYLLMTMRLRAASEFRVLLRRLLSRK